MDYKKAYALLLGTMSNAIDEINQSGSISSEVEKAMQILKEGLEKAEEMYIDSEK